MGITWRAMPLLSTLAALVIIVHSAEEDLERDYRYQLRPRALDTGTPNHDQPWSNIQAEPLSGQLIDLWEDPPEEPEPMKRRRPVRKRKRRPTANSEERLIEEKNIYFEEPERLHLFPVEHEDSYEDKPLQNHESDEPLRYRDTQYNPETTTEMPRRRRKRPENKRNRWPEEYTERPMRRRGQRRKRPSADGWPKLTEFEVRQQPPRLAEPEIIEVTEFEVEQVTPRLAEPEKIEDNENIDKSELISLDLFNKDFHEKNRQTQSISLDLFNNDFQEKSRQTQPEKARSKVTEPINKPLDNNQMKEDKSLSEFSSESIHASKFDLENEKKALEKSSTFKILQKIKDKTPPYYWSHPQSVSDSSSFLNKDNVKYDIIFNILHKKIHEKTPVLLPASKPERDRIITDYEMKLNRYFKFPSILRPSLKKPKKAKSSYFPLLNFSSLDEIFGMDEELNMDKTSRYNWRHPQSVSDSSYFLNKDKVKSDMIFNIFHKKGHEKTPQMLPASKPVRAPIITDYAINLNRYFKFPSILTPSLKKPKNAKSSYFPLLNFSSFDEIYGMDEELNMDKTSRYNWRHPQSVSDSSSFLNNDNVKSDMIFNIFHKKGHEKTPEMLPASQLVRDPIITDNEMNLNRNFKFPSILTPRLKKPKNAKSSYFSLLNFSSLDEIFGMDEELNMENRPIDPVTLKEILKRSNGTSLSEILQQNNLSLTDLLRGKEDYVSVLEPEDTVQQRNGKYDQVAVQNTNIQDDDNQNKVQLTTETVIEMNDSVQNPETGTDKGKDLESQSTGRDTKVQSAQLEETTENAPKNMSRRRYPGVRRKLRLRPPMNGTYKSQLNRDLMAQTARKYHNSRNITKSKEWKYVIPLMNSSDSSEELNNYKIEVTDMPTTTTSIPEETTVLHSDYYSPSTLATDVQTEISNKFSDDETMAKETTTYTPTTLEPTTADVTTTTEKSKMSRIRPPASRMGLRRQAFNNRLKRKRMKQKNSTTEPTVEQDDLPLDFFGMPNLVSSSEFIAQTQTPKPMTADNNDEDFTTLDDFMTTEKSRHAENGPRFTRNSTLPRLESGSKSTSTTTRYSSTTEETAKFEIEEILNDTRTSARLSRILMERNMTLSELVQHRERGSSHVHLADIFHNASKEPNPPEPFLSKSSIEPISKETYPLRAILEANLHDSSVKATTIDPNILQAHFVNIPMVMDFGNNVNENGENMGIMSLFNKLTGSDIIDGEKSSTGKDSDGTPYITTIIAVNNTELNETAREGKAIKEDGNNLNNDVVGWRALFELMRKEQHNDTDDLIAPNTDDSTSKTNKNVLLQDDSMIIFEDLQHMKDFDSSKATEKIEITSYEESDAPPPGILDRVPSHTRSVTVATASIIGLAMILFLLTYAAFKWKQQRTMLRKKQNERIPTPVFEHRKGHKNNCSTRSISPMLASSNIYTMNTLDSRTGKESPDYMWDSLRKPFQ